MVQPLYDFMLLTLHAQFPRATQDLRPFLFLMRMIEPLLFVSVFIDVLAHEQLDLLNDHTYLRDSHIRLPRTVSEFVLLVSFSMLFASHIPNLCFLGILLFSRSTHEKHQHSLYRNGPGTKASTAHAHLQRRRLLGRQMECKNESGLFTDIDSTEYYRVMPEIYSTQVTAPMNSCMAQEGYEDW